MKATTTTAMAAFLMASVLYANPAHAARSVVIEVGAAAALASARAQVSAVPDLAQKMAEQESAGARDEADDGLHFGDTTIVPGSTGGCEGNLNIGSISGDQAVAGPRRLQVIVLGDVTQMVGGGCR